MNNNRNHNGLSRGLGDSIARFTRSTGISNLAQMGARALGKKDCGCNKRKEVLNKAFPYKNK
jgi:hypothetical protein